jgi:two-component system, OmpR family, sensor histidine kinase CreC
MRFTRVTLLVIAFIILLGFYQLARHFVADVEPQIFQATEEVMVDMANLLAEIIERDYVGKDFKPHELRDAFGSVHGRVLAAEIFEHTKRHVGIQAYLTDSKGIVVFDTDSGRREGLDFSEKRDVARTLAGNYGARSSRDDDRNSKTSVLYVGAAVGDIKNPLGVLTVYKAQADVMPLVTERRKIIYTACALIGGGILFLIGAVFLWLFRPIGRITDYAKAIERGERPAKPKIGIGREVNTLARALDSMRSALEGRRYAERYIQTLTHELKSPLAAICGAAELLDEEMAPEIRHRFLENIRAEAARSERLINRLLELSVIENRSSSEVSERVDFGSITVQAIDQSRPMAHVAGVTLKIRGAPSPLWVIGDSYILCAAVTNLLENAIDFSRADCEVFISVEKALDRVVLTIRDYGSGIPEYAREKVFERFYSLRHHASKRKGTGLGLTLVREAAELHRGTITLEPADGGGTLATLNLPLG